MRIAKWLAQIEGRRGILAISDQPLHLIMSEDIRKLSKALTIALDTVEWLAQHRDGLPTEWRSRENIDRIVALAEQQDTDQ